MRKILRNLLNWLDKRAAKKQTKRVKSSNNTIEEPFKEFVSVLIENDCIDLNEECDMSKIWYHKKFNLFKLEKGNNTIVEFKLQDTKEEN